jgi:DNA helicase II / ATP-dependent DNA helicase PcrA
MLVAYDYKASLNVSQLSALDNFPGELLIVAGAGTGKTSTIVAKILHAINTGFAQPHQILATTFTNKAATELKLRLKKYLGDVYREITIGTFHSISLEILQHNLSALSGITSINVLPYDDQIQVVRGILAKYALKDMRPSIVLEKIQRYKEEQSAFPGIDHRIINEYKYELTKANMMDFADLILKTIDLFDKNHEIRENYQSQLKLVCIDEYQDINDLQYKWVSYIHGKNHLCCVGDPDQAIYGFRGANAKHILNFSDNFRSSKVVKLECNYRSTQSILNNANKLISHNRSRIPKNLYTNNTQDERKVLLYSARSSRLEAENICDIFCNIKKTSQEKLSIAILVRSRIQIPDIEEALIKNQISYKIYGAMQFMDRAEIKDIISYLKFIHNHNDSISFNRMIQAPKRGIGLVTIKKIMQVSEEMEVDLLVACKIVAQSSSNMLKDKLVALVNLFETAHQIKNSDLIVLANHIYINSGYIDSLNSDRRENIQQWMRTLVNYQSLTEYLEQVLWQADTEEQKNEHDIEIMTIHASKGLEFDYTFLPGWEDGILPHDFATSEHDLEEERRLAYVAITRARQQAIISYSNTRMINGKIKSYNPSRFLRELQGVEYCTISTSKTFQVGSEVIHPRFGLGLVQETGSDLARVRFCDIVRLVELKMLRVV